MAVKEVPGLATEAATQEDVEQVYRLFLRREFSDDPGSSNPHPWVFRTLIETVVLSDEFCAANLGPISTGHVPNSSLDCPDAELIAWARRRLPISARSKQAIRDGANFLQVYCAVLLDKGLTKTIEGFGARYSPELLRRFDTARRLQGLADLAFNHTLQGWARNLDTPDDEMMIEVWANGRCMGTTQTGLYRADAAARLRSRGFEGYRFELPGSLSGRTHILIRDVRTRLILTDMYADLESKGGMGVEHMRREIADLRQAIEALSARLPEQSRHAAHSLECYGQYYDLHVRDTRLASEPAGGDTPVQVLLDAVDCQQADLNDAMESLAAQSHQNFRVLVGVRKRDLSYLMDVLTRLRWKRDLPVDYVVTSGEPDWRLSPEAAWAEARVVQLMKADSVLHADALRCMVAALEAGDQPSAAYADGDVFEGQDLRDWRVREHNAPDLKPAFDIELLNQVPYVGELVAFDREAWRAVQSACEGVGGRLAHLPSRGVRVLAGQGATIAHVPEILETRSAERAVDKGWLAVVRDTLTCAAEVSPQQDLLGATVAGAARLSWPVPEGATAAIVIPTRDRLDLLKPCVDSILNGLEANRTRATIHIIDHQSVEEDTIAYLASLAGHEAVRVQTYEGEFNWALMNNLAVHVTNEDVLIFLNNDTLVINPDWIDELVSQALRPDVGVVGCRLLYEDGAIQHAGFLSLDGPDNFLSHDGLAEPGYLPGYGGRNALVHQTVAVTGACMAVRREVFRQLGGFDAARFNVEGNDVDLCFKALRDGLKVLYTPFATLYHLESRTRTLTSEADLKGSREATSRLWQRWGDMICPDRWYNPRFDRRSAHFTRLKP